MEFPDLEKMLNVHAIALLGLSVQNQKSGTYGKIGYEWIAAW
jgi:hypothetical protein